MDDFSDSSDELHVEILGLLDGVPANLGVRNEVALVACELALEHALSLNLLIESPLVSYTYLNGNLWPISAVRDGQQSADSVEKVGLHKTLEYCWVKTPFLHVAT